MTIPTKEATIAELERRKEIYEERKERIIFHIEENPGQSQYKLSKELEIPRPTLIRMLDELVEEKQIKFEEITENGRQKKKYYIMKITDFTWDYFNISNFVGDHGMGEKTKILALSTLNRGIPITIEMANGSEEIVESTDRLDFLIHSNS